MCRDGNLKADLVRLFICAANESMMLELLLHTAMVRHRTRRGEATICCVLFSVKALVNVSLPINKRAPSQHPPVCIRPCTRSSTYCEGPGQT